MEIFSNGGFNFGEEGLNILAGRLDEELPVVLADVLAQKVESLVDMRDQGFLPGEASGPASSIRGEKLWRNPSK